MVKVIYANGTEAIFNASDFTHNERHHLFFVVLASENRIMIPDNCVACIGICDIDGDFV